MYSTPNEAALFLKKLIYLLQHLSTCHASMSEGSLRCDANVSVRRATVDSSEPLGERCEIKNLNSIKALVNAIEFESKRQIDLLESGGTVELETRWFDPQTKTTFTARKKEDKIDYRYFPEPDLPALIIPQEVISSALESLPKLPDDIITEMVETFRDVGITPNIASLISLEHGGVDYFKSVLAASPQIDPKTVALWLTNDIYGFINADANLKMDNFPLSPKNLAMLIQLIEEEYVSVLKANNVLNAIIKEGDKRDPKAIVDANDWGIVTMDQLELEKKCLDLIEKWKTKAESYRDGEVQWIHFFMGHMVRENKGKVSTKRVQQTLEKLLMKK